MFECSSAATAVDDRPADALCEPLSAAIDGIAADDPSTLDFAGQLARLRAVGRMIDRLEAERVRLLDTADRSGALADDGAATVAAWLRRHSTLTATQATDRARIARRLARLPGVAAAFAAGDLGLSHVIQIDRLCKDVGTDQVAGVQTELVIAAGRLRDVGEFTRLCAGWRHALRPDANDAADDRAYDNRRLAHTATLDGAFHLSGAFDAEGGATIAAALNAYMHRDAPGTPPEERRTISQRRADAMVAIARVALASADAPQVAGARPRVVVRVDLADLISDLVSGSDHPDQQRPGRPRRAPVSPATVDWAGPIGPAAVERLLDDAVITRVVFGTDGQPLDVGKALRVWPAAIRTAITERDRGCRFDPCDRPAEWCDIDHVIPFSEGGPTAVTNGILLCRHHHRAKRRENWWPTLDPDGTVTWTHADGRTRIDPPPRRIDDHVRTLLDAGGGDPPPTPVGHRYPAPGHSGGERDSTAGEARGSYHPNRAPPTGDPPRGGVRRRRPHGGGPTRTWRCRMPRPR